MALSSRPTLTVRSGGQFTSTVHIPTFPLPLRIVDEIRDLGVVIASSLSWNRPNQKDNIIIDGRPRGLKKLLMPFFVSRSFQGQTKSFMGENVFAWRNIFEVLNHVY